MPNMFGTNNTRSTMKKARPKSGMNRGRAENPMGGRHKRSGRSGITYSTSTMNKQAGQRGA